MGTGNKSDSSKDKDSMLRHSPPAMNRRGNILDNLLAKSDVIKSADTSERKSNLNFVLGDQYRSANSKGKVFTLVDGIV